MKIAIVAPSPVPFALGGAENLWRGLHAFLDQHSEHQAELVKLPAPESGVWELLESYRRFSELDLSHFDVVISGKYPAWMVAHPHHLCYMVHRLRGLYDTYGYSGQPREMRSRHPGLCELQDFQLQHAGRREALPEFFARLDALRRGGDLPAEALAFPGPWIRELVHFLDGIGLAPTAIRRYAAISHNLVQRPDYFPAGVEVRALHPPSSLEGLRCEEEGRHFFSIARLDGPKRVGLLVQAMRLAKSELPLVIAGSGPEEAALRELAGGDPRIRFVGRVSDAEAARLYAGARGVLYAPADEDYGLVAYEAMVCAKPVIITRDSGGPLELVEDGENGFVVAPEPERIAERIDALAERPELARALGRNGQRRAARISWESVVAGLLDETVSEAPAQGGAQRQRLVVATTFPIHPATGGGQVRAYELYRRLAQDFDVEVVSLAAEGTPRLRKELAPGLRETRIPMSAEHARAERRLSKQVDWVPLTDVAFARLHELTPAYAAALAEQLPGARAVVASHPFAWPAIESVQGGVPLWYEAHNVELDLKEQVLPDSAAGREWVEETRRVEAACCQRAELLFSASPGDGQRLSELYPAPARTEVVPNGVDTDAIPFVGPAERQRNQQALGLDGVFSVLFLGSWHPPNLVAVRQLLEMALRLPKLRFLVLGGVGQAFAADALPPNVALAGVVEQDVKALTLATVDVALNPMSQGSGTNLKLLEYCAAGVPVITTPLGGRGVELRDGEHLRVAELGDFPRAIEEERARRGSPEQEARLLRARREVERLYAWQVIASRFARSIRELPAQGSG